MNYPKNMFLRGGTIRIIYWICQQNVETLEFDIFMQLWQIHLSQVEVFIKGLGSLEQIKEQSFFLNTIPQDLPLIQNMTEQNGQGGKFTNSKNIILRFTNKDKHLAI